MTIPLENILDKLPIDPIGQSLHEYLQPLEKRLPDQRLKRVVEEMVLGILGGETAVITEMARQNHKSQGESWATAKRIYRWLLKPERGVIHKSTDSVLFLLRIAPIQLSVELEGGYWIFQLTVDV